MPETLLALVVVLALNVYALTGGADFGGGVWDLLSGGPRKREQQHLIHKAVGPIWEANHVWLIVVVVVLFACFPVGFAALTTALHVPLTLMLLGIVLRGSAFVFTTHGPRGPGRQRWERVFAVASTITPVMLGTCLGAVASGSMRLDARQRVITDFLSEWLAPFPVALGFLTLSLFAFLAAIYLAAEAGSGALAEDFRTRAFGGAAAVFVCAWVTLWLAQDGAPRLFHGLARSSWAVLLHAGVGGTSVAALAALWRRRFRWAQVFAAGQVSLMVWGWALAQQPFLIAPDLDIHTATAPPAVMRAVLWTLVAGGVVLVPSFVALYAVFKGGAGRRAASTQPTGASGKHAT